MSRGYAMPRWNVFSGVAAPAEQPGTTIDVIPPLGRMDHPGRALALGAVGAAAFFSLNLLDARLLAGDADDLGVLIASCSGVAAMLLMARRPLPQALVYRPLALALALSGLGLAVLALGPTFGRGPTWILANMMFAAAVAVAMIVLAPTFYRRLDSRAAASALLDGGIMLVAGTTVLITLWHTPTGMEGLGVYLIPVVAACLFASAGMAAVAALSMRAAPVFRGIWAGIVGVLLLGLSWILCVNKTVEGFERDALVTGLYALGLLVVAYGWMTWAETSGPTGLLYQRVATSLADWLPVAAILLCVLVAAVPHGRIGSVDPAPIGMGLVIVLTIFRQRLLVLSERRVVHRLAGEMEERAQAMLSLARLEQADTLEATADRICTEALRLEAVDSAGVYVFGPSGAVVPLALRGAYPEDEAVGQPISARRALHIRSSAGAGTWVDTTGEEPQFDRDSFLAEAFAPMHWDERVVGVVAIGTARRDDAVRLHDRLSTLSEFGVVSAALMGPALVEEWRVADVRALLTQVIDSHAFRPVFQPVVMLRNREIVGYEALTRFADGTRPDKRFHEAHTAGMSVRLEMACLSDQLEAAAWLPQGTWVSLNVSPALASAVVPLVASLERADRDVVLEITEHVEIEDYRALIAALELIRGRARLAVDDAGAGYAGLRHILELRPNFVKLDVSLVRNVDSDPARQAMVAGMAHFAHDAGCELIAEGIETDGEMAQLVRLGVVLGQGFLFGKPSPVA